MPETIFSPGFFGKKNGNKSVLLSLNYSVKESSNFQNDFLYLMEAAGDQSFGIVCPADQIDKYMTDHRQLPENQLMKTLTTDILEEIALKNDTDVLDLDFLSSVERIFQSSACLNGSLLSQTHSACSSKNPGVDLAAWKSAFEKIESCKNDSLSEAIYSGIANFVLPRLKQEPPDVEALRLYLPLHFYHRFDDVKWMRELLIPYASRLINLCENAWNVIEKWIKMQDASYLLPLVQKLNRGVVKLLHEMRDAKAYQEELDRSCMTLLIFLKILNRINVETNLIINYEDFYIPEVSTY